MASHDFEKTVEAATAAHGDAFYRWCQQSGSEPTESNKSIWDASRREFGNTLELLKPALMAEMEAVLRKHQYIPRRQPQASGISNLWGLLP